MGFDILKSVAAAFEVFTSVFKEQTLNVQRGSHVFFFCQGFTSRDVIIAIKTNGKRKATRGN